MIVAGNWKMNKTPSEAAAFVKELIPRVKGAKSEVVVAAPFVALPGVAEAARGTNIKVAAQNMHYEAKGAYTGEVSADMLKDAGADYVIIGHSERRQYFGETDETVNRKVQAATAAGLIPIVCVGESLAQREQGITPEVVRRQVKIALLGVSAETLLSSGLVIAYEPIWAIGTGKTATNEQANEVCHTIRMLLAELYGAEAAAKVSIQYGGSVTAANAKELFAMPDINGGLVGGASLKAADFEVIANA
ncbi:MAG: triose-phosphate isomerase [Clostridiales bacterium]|nr:triose-phosphate isomerase [Clostridiales bacterium]